MVSDSMANASVTAFSKDSSSKKKKTSRFAKLKQSKLDVRREQWLAQVNSKNDKVDPDGVVESPASCMGEANRTSGLRENLQMRTNEDEPEMLRVHDSESESLMSSSIGSRLGHDCLGKGSIGGGSSSSSSGCCSGSVSEEERDDGCLDDWEAIADALTSESNQDQHSEPENSISNDFDPASETSNLKEASGVTHWSRDNNRAWRPDDASRPQSLPNPSKLYNINSQSGSCMFNRETVWSWRSIPSQPSSCPICCEDLDLTDSSFLPCPCGFRLCLFCHKRILEDDCRCPGCRRQYESLCTDSSLVDDTKCQATFASIMKIRF